jgi:hypothetical protein
MNPECNKEWSRKFIATHFTKKFISTNLKTHREKVLYDQQRALLPATQPLVERNIKLEKIDSEIEELKQAYNKIRRIMNEKYTEKRAVMTGANATRGERATFVRACPDENCRGFLSSQWKCGLCEKWTCNHCHVLKGPDRNIEHTCNPDDIATAELLANDTKPCPSCGTGIFKIDGCDQMWCTSCNTGFSWRTGRIENTIHNPHYFEWLRRNGGQIPRAEGEIQCGREIDNHTAIHIRNRLEKHKTKPNYNDYKIKIAFDVCRAVIHNRYTGYYNEVDATHANEELRISYMRGRIDEETFKRTIQRNDKKYEKRRAIRDVVLLINTSATDIIYRFMEEIRSRDWDCNCSTLDEFIQLREYANNLLDEVSKTYNSIRIQVKRDLSF